MLRFIFIRIYLKSKEVIFQNISCYGLSEASLSVLHPLGQFQNISCYGLSCGKSFYQFLYRISKHLMLRFIAGLCSIFFRIFFISKHLMLRFIRIKPRFPFGKRKISKHLMLRFIEDVTKALAINKKFQNISCYGLSMSIWCK